MIHTLITSILFSTERRDEMMICKFKKRSHRDSDQRNVRVVWLLCHSFLGVNIVKQRVIVVNKVMGS